MDKTLSEDLKDWRTKWPDEWVMGRFIEKAIALEDAKKTPNDVFYDALMAAITGVLGSMQADIDPAQMDKVVKGNFFIAWKVAMEAKRNANEILSGD